MQTLSYPVSGSSDAEVSPAFNVVIAYDDLETGKRAMRTYNYLVEHLGDECIFANQMWKFDVLAVPKLREIAAKDTAAAEVIIISAHEANDFSPAVKAWIESWLSYKTRASALVALFDTEAWENPARDYLAGIARRAGIEFFAQPGVLPNSTKSANSISGGLEQNQKTFSVLANVVQEEQGFSHWGINE